MDTVMTGVRRFGLVVVVAFLLVRLLVTAPLGWLLGHLPGRHRLAPLLGAAARQLRRGAPRAVPSLAIAGVAALRPRGR